MSVYSKEKINHDDEKVLKEWYQSVQAAVKIEPKHNTLTPEGSSIEPTVGLTDFDPNFASFNDLVHIGFSELITRRIISYRNHGGSFVYKEDLFKIYEIDSSFVHKIFPYLLLPAKPTPTKITSTNQGEIKKLIKVDLNIAGPEDLISTYGLGPVLSGRIVKYRDLIGGFYDFDQLHEVYGLEDSTIQRMKERYFIDSTKLNKIRINAMDVSELARHPYVSYNLAKIILNYRGQHGLFDSVEELKEIAILSDSVYNKLVPYIEVDSP